MYFSLEVKTKREDFFDMDEEFNTLRSELLDPYTRMVVIKGLRRTGKSSLLHVALNETGLPHILIDLRLAAPPTPETFYEYFSAELSKFLEDGGLRKALSMIKGLEVSGLKLEFSEKKPSVIGRVLEEVGRRNRGRQLVLAIDEAQALRYIRGFGEVLAHIYDYVDGVKIVLTGSEVGLLDRFIGVGNPKAPLFGRAYTEIVMGRLSSEKALLFLREGFSQMRVKVPQPELEQAIQRLDGVIGWLTYYGHLRSKGVETALERAVEDGMKMAAEEFKQFLSIRPVASRRYIEVLKTLVKPSTWSEVKRALSTVANVSDKQLSSFLKELVDYGFVEKKNKLYMIADPLLAEAARRGAVL